MQKRHPNLSMKGIWNFHLVHKQTKGKNALSSKRSNYSFDRNPPVTSSSMIWCTNNLPSRYATHFRQCNRCVGTKAKIPQQPFIHHLYSAQNRHHRYFALQLTWSRQALRLITPVCKLRPGARENLSYQRTWIPSTLSFVVATEDASRLVLTSLPQNKRQVSKVNSSLYW